MKSNIIHHPVFETKLISDYYTEKDGVVVLYVCTTELGPDNIPVDIFYRRKKAKGIESRYFGLFYSDQGEAMILEDAARITELEIPMVKDDDGNYRYSRQESERLDFANGNFVAGGRKVSYYGPKGILTKAIKGKMIQVNAEPPAEIGNEEASQKDEEVISYAELEGPTSDPAL
jgi:hypothetical protein